VKHLLGTKLDGQLGVLLSVFAAHDGSIEVMEPAQEALDSASSMRSALSAEARAASSYWEAWRKLSLRFPPADEGKVPGHWRVFGERHSLLSTSPRKAATAAGAILN
jgi:hypothetical protein